MAMCSLRVTGSIINTGMIYQEIRCILNTVLIKDYGDDLEKEYFPKIQEYFPNFENFWQIFVVPTTYRIYKFSTLIVDPCIRRTRQEAEQSTCTPYPINYNWKEFEQQESRKPNYIDTRPEVSSIVKEAGLLHYSILLQLYNISKHLIEKNFDYFEDAFVHLASISDLVEDFVCKLFHIIYEVKGMKIDCLKQLSKEEFLLIADKWYDNNYMSTYDHYLSKGKFRPIKIPGKDDIIKEFLKDYQPWKETYKYFLSLKTYRNKIVHQSFILSIFSGGNHYVPNIDCINKYSTYDLIKDASKNQSILSHDFCTKELMIDNNYHTVMNHLNNLWGHLISIFKEILKQENQLLLKKMGFENNV